MKTDSLFYRLFQTLPSLLFDLIDISLPETQPYQFQSVEIKQTAFRVDGVFAPPEANPQLPLFFVEVQFQPQVNLYSRLFSEIFLYLRQYQPSNPWQAVVIYPSRSVDVGETRHYQELLNSSRTWRIYLDELPSRPQSLSLGLLQLVTIPEERAVETARELVQRTRQEIDERSQLEQILDLIETIIVYKLPRLSREEIVEMLDFTERDVRQTQFYQDVFAEGRQEGEAALVLRLLQRRFGELPSSVTGQIRALSVEQIEELAVALLDFSSLEDLQSWLQNY